MFAEEDVELDVRYKQAIIRLAEELAKFNRGLPGLLEEMRLLRGAIRNMPHSIRLRP
jgi:hypothetical protein